METFVFYCLARINLSHKFSLFRDLYKIYVFLQVIRLKLCFKGCVAFSVSFPAYDLGIKDMAVCAVFKKYSGLWASKCLKIKDMAAVPIFSVDLKIHDFSCLN